MHNFIDQTDTLASTTADGTVYRCTATGWAPADLDPQALAGPGWRTISAHEAVQLQRAMTFGPMG